MAEKVYKNRVKEKYEKEVVPFLMKKFGYTDGPMKLALHTNMDEFNPCAYWRKPGEECSYLGKYDIHPEIYMWIDKA